MTFQPTHYGLRHWKPSEYIPCHDPRPPVPCLIALNRKPYRLVGIREIPPDQWRADDWEAYETAVAWRTQAGKPYPTPEEWDRRPVEFVLTDLKGEEKFSAHAQAWEYRRDGWHLLHEHHTVCASCGELAPCREYIAARMREFAAQQAREKLEKDLVKVPGCCWSCGEPVTDRQKWIAFEGMNLDLPGGPDVIFHLRQKCRGEAIAYEKRWVKEDPRRRRMLSCPGFLIIHVDGPECNEGPLCPGAEVRHASYSNHLLYTGSICLRCKDARARQAMEG